MKKNIRVVLRLLILLITCAGGTTPTFAVPSGYDIKSPKVHKNNHKDYWVLDFNSPSHKDEKHSYHQYKDLIWNHRFQGYRIYLDIYKKGDASGGEKYQIKRERCFDENTVFRIPRKPENISSVNELWEEESHPDLITKKQGDCFHTSRFYHCKSRWIKSEQTRHNIPASYFNEKKTDYLYGLLIKTHWEGIITHMPYPRKPSEGCEGDGVRVTSSDGKHYFSVPYISNKSAEIELDKINLLSKKATFKWDVVKEAEGYCIEGRAVNKEGKVYRFEHHVDEPNTVNTEIPLDPTIHSEWKLIDNYESDPRNYEFNGEDWVYLFGIRVKEGGSSLGAISHWLGNTNDSYAGMYFALPLKDQNLLTVQSVNNMYTFSLENDFGCSDNETQFLLKGVAINSSGDEYKLEQVIRGTSGNRINLDPLITNSKVFTKWSKTQPSYTDIEFPDNESWIYRFFLVNLMDDSFYGWRKEKNGLFAKYSDLITEENEKIYFDLKWDNDNKRNYSLQSDFIEIHDTHVSYDPKPDLCLLGEAYKPPVGHNLARPQLKWRGAKIINPHIVIIQIEPEAPDNVSAISVSNGLKLFWDPVDKATHYYIIKKHNGTCVSPWTTYQSSKDGQFYNACKIPAKIVFQGTSIDNVSFIDTDVEPGVIREYAVQSDIDILDGNRKTSAWISAAFTPMVIADDATKSWFESPDARLKCGETVSVHWECVTNSTDDINIEFIQGEEVIWSTSIANSNPITLSMPEVSSLTPGVYTLKFSIPGTTPEISGEWEVRVGFPDYLSLNGDVKLQSGTYYAHDVMVVKQGIAEDADVTFVAPEINFNPGFEVPENATMSTILDSEYSGLSPITNFQVTPEFNQMTTGGQIFDICRMKLNWEYPKNSLIYGFVGEMSIDGGAWQNIGHVDASGRSLHTPNLALFEIARSIAFRISTHAKNEYRRNFYSKEIVLVPDEVLLSLNSLETDFEGQPKKPIGKDYVNLCWTSNNEGVVDFNVFRAIDDGENILNYQKITTVSKGSNKRYEYKDNTVALDTKYSYKVVANGMSFDKKNPFKTRTSNHLNVETYPVEIFADILFSNQQYQWRMGEKVDNHWIPNDHTFLDSLQMNVYSSKGKTLPELYRDVAILPPADACWKEEVVDGNSLEANNIFCNRGNYPIELYVHDNDEKVAVCTFKLKDSPVSGEESYEIITCNDTYFEIRNGAVYPKEGNTLAVNEEGIVTLNSNYGYFAVRLPEGVEGTIRPGDDLLLRFSLANYPSVLTAQVGNKDKLAIYDKKMLWRANLYIDERKLDDETNDQDWNNLYPWIIGNEWNKVYNATERLRDYSTNTDILRHDLSELPVPEQNSGGQNVIIKSATVDEGVNIHNAVAYSTGCHDSPFEYSDEVLQQQKCLETIWTELSDPDNETIIINTPLLDGYINEKDYSLMVNNDVVLEESFAPENIYSNYFFPVNQDYGWEAIDFTGSLFDGYFPFIPGGTGGNALIPYNYKFRFAISSGVDEVGFVQTVASYWGNSYVWEDLDWNHNPTNSETWQPPYEFMVNNVPLTTERKITESDYWTIATSSDNVLLIDNVLPGDIFIHYIKDEDFTYEYPSLVLAVDPSEREGLSSVKLITAIETNLNGNKIQNVTNEITAAHYENHNWKIVRLKNQVEGE